MQQHIDGAESVILDRLLMILAGRNRSAKSSQWEAAEAGLRTPTTLSCTPVEETLVSYSSRNSNGPPKT